MSEVSMVMNERQLEKLKTYSKLTSFAGNVKSERIPEKALHDSLAKAAAKVKRAGEHARVRVHLTGEGETFSRTLRLSGKAAAVDTATADAAELELYLSRSDYWDMARGKVSPAELFLRGRLAVHGDCKLARRLYRLLAANEETAEIHA